MNIDIVPQFEDNYGYLIYEHGTGVCAAVDVGDHAPVLEAAKSRGLKIGLVLTTHAHWDHAGGIPKLLEAVPDARVFAGKGDGVPKASQEVWEGDTIALGKITFKVLATPCHTPGHVCYLATHTDDDKQAVFTGDTLFVAGCGRFNQGGPADMHKALYKVLGELPGETQVYVGHEYTVNNLLFAKHVDPDNKEVVEKLAWARHQREQGIPTVPSTIASEWRTNPFMQCDRPEIQAAMGRSNPIDALAEMRHKKNNWRPS